MEPMDSNGMEGPPQLRPGFGAVEVQDGDDMKSPPQLRRSEFHTTSEQFLA